MILGTGETGMDLAYEAAKAGAEEAVLCSRAGYGNPISFAVHCRLISLKVSVFPQSFGKPQHSAAWLHRICSDSRELQNDFEVFGMEFKSEHPVPIDSLITNLAETAYVVSVYSNRNILY